MADDIKKEVNDRFIGIKINSRYEILNKIASGGMADVYLGQDLKLNRKVAAKILHESYSSNRNFTARLKREAQIHANLNSPNIVTVYDWGEFNNLYFIIMEFVNGKSLKEIIDKKGAIDPRLAAKYSVQICKALELAHENNLIHRDIKPQNIMITEEDIVKVTDFGIAKFTVGDTTKTISILGTAYYVSPEQAQGKILDNRSDIYSLGIVMYEMLAADVPFRGGDLIDIGLRHISENPQPPSMIHPEIPKNIEKIVMKCLEKNPDYRYQNILSLRIDLQNFLEGKPLLITQKQTNGQKKMQIFSNADYYRYDNQFEKAFEKYKLKNNRIRSILISACSFMVIAFIVFLTLFLISNSKSGHLTADLNMVNVPQLQNVEFESAKNMLLAYGLIIEAQNSTYSDSVPNNYIISQSIKPNTKVNKNIKVYVTVSKGKEISTIPMPNLIGIRKESALEQLENLGLSAGSITEEFSDIFGNDTVIEQKPIAGTLIKQYTEVSISISKGRERITIPYLNGYEYVYAKSLLESLGLLVDAKRKTDNTIQPGIVLGVEPFEGSSVFRNSNVMLIISTGEELVPVPDLSNMDFKIAQQILDSFDIGFEVNYIIVDNPAQKNSVISQYPEAGEQIELKEKIILFVGQ